MSQKWLQVLYDKEPELATLAESIDVKTDTGVAKCFSEVFSLDLATLSSVTIRHYRLSLNVVQHFAMRF